MARLTFEEICEQGAIIGQNDAAPDWVAIKMKSWLRKHYEGWAWPFLITQATGISLASGTTELSVGGAQGGLTNQISRIFSPIYARANGYSTRVKCPVRTIAGDPLDFAIGMQDSDVNVGAPQSFIALPAMTAAGLRYIKLTPYPIPNDDFTLAFTYQRLPTDPESSTVPDYPNEMTLIQAAKVAALEYDQSLDPGYHKEAEILAQMVSADRAAYGSSLSFGDVMQLDSSIFLP
jgi:hypothetical protein